MRVGSPAGGAGAVPVGHGDSDHPLEKAAAPEDDAAVPIGPEDAVWGLRTALVTIVEFSDFSARSAAAPPAR